MTIKNIIFHLGGVIIDIDYNRTSEAFRKLGAFNFDAIYTQSKQDNLFDNYEVGKISSNIFRDALTKKLDISVKNEEFDNAWNAMLLDLPKNRLDFIKNLRKNYKIFLFSNTNEIHLRKVFDICQKQNGFNTFDNYFDKEYYSNIFGKKKPSPDAFISILNENNIEANETLFIDDSMQHILGARQAGLHATHLSNEKSIFHTVSFIENVNNSQLKEEKSDLNLARSNCKVLAS
ncbi:MAG: hypothetical protein ACD_45C00701G0010 [uncultured bacterium]|nr:MAG: hypothetical protein ACD_45C00701G0010 [uncultured bacterium]